MGGRDFPRREKKKPKKEERKVARSPLTPTAPVEVPVVRPKGKKREEEV